MLSYRALKDAMRGHWRDALPALGVDQQYLGRHSVDCPFCGGRDDYRFTDKGGDGMHYCNHCGGGDGFKLLELVTNDPRAAVAQWLGMAASNRDETRQHVTASEVAQRETEAQREAAQRAQRRWSRATPCVDHPYLTRKGVQSHGLRVVGDYLLMPIVDAYTNELISTQYIRPDGSKGLEKGARKAGGCYVLGVLDASPVVLIAEGYATAASLYEATSYPVVVALDAANLTPVCTALRARLPRSTLLLCADHDRSQTGQSSAIGAATACNGSVVMPLMRGDCKGVDWNDVHASEGLDAVREAIEERLAIMGG